MGKLRDLFTYTLFILGLGIALHDFAHELYLVGGYREILSIQGGYIGFIMMIVAFFILVKEKNTILKRSR